jgi:RES domain-containing protein
LRGAIRVWRIVKRKHVDRAFDGEGAKQEGGRWNSPGVPMVYASGNISLALLETLVHADQEDLAGGSYVAIPVEIPSSVRVKHIDQDSLPKGWQKHDPSPRELRRIGDGWIRDCRQGVLAVPSVVLPRERNYLINPAHKDMKRLVIGTPEPIPLDGRLLKDVKT